jgi:hypothetical protein
MKTPFSQSPLNIQEMPGLISKYRGWIITATISGMILCTLAASQVPKKYKSHFVLTIYSKYFQSPLIGDFVPELSESGEIRSQRESLIRQVVTPEYLDFLAAKYGIYGSPKSPSLSWHEKLLSHLRTWTEHLGLTPPVNPDSKLSAEREDLRSRIEIDSLNSTTFNVGFVYSDPASTYGVTRDIHAEVIQSLLGLRVHTLTNIRDAVQKRLESLPPPPLLATTPVAPTVVAGGSETVEDELAGVRSQLHVLTSQDTEEHPLVMQLRDRERILVSRLDSLRASGYRTRRERASGEAGSTAGTLETYSDLTKKLNYLNIAIDSDREHQSDYFATLETPLYPSAPLWPKKSLFALWGLALGLFGSLFIAALRENFDRSALHVRALAQQLRLPLLGELPIVPSNTTQRTSPGATTALKAPPRT